MSSEEIRRLRLGMATVMREPSSRRRAHLLDTAIDLGLRKFDTAPIYGLGAANHDLSALVKRGPGPIQVTNKFGRALSARARAISPFQAPLRTILQRSASMRRVARSGHGGVTIPPAPPFAQVREQAMRSCELFRMESLDEFLSHDISLDASWENLFREIIQRRDEIPVRHLGISGGGDLIAQYPSDIEENVDVLQTPLEDGPRGGPAQQTVLFGALSGLARRVNNDTPSARNLRRMVDESDLATGLYPLLLAICLKAFPKADVVVGTSSVEHLRTLVVDASAWLQRDDLEWTSLLEIASTDRRGRSFNE